MKTWIDEINDGDLNFEATDLDIDIPEEKSEPEHIGSHSIELSEAIVLIPDLDLDLREETQGGSGDNNERTNNVKGIRDIVNHFFLFADLFLCKCLRCR